MTRIIVPSFLAVAGVFMGDAISSKTEVQLGEALAVAMVIVPATYWISRQLQKLIDNQAVIKTELNGLHERITSLRDRMNGLACQHGREPDDCPGKPENQSDDS